MIKEFIADSLQVFFPTDFGLWFHLNRNTLPGKRIKLPVVYADNVLSTLGVPEAPRQWVIPPEKLSLNPEALGWRSERYVRRGKEKRAWIIPAEKPKIAIKFSNSEIILEIIPSYRCKEHYHLEYVGGMNLFSWENWLGLYFTIDQFKEIANKAIEYAGNRSVIKESKEIVFETKLRKREELHYVRVKPTYYVFSPQGYSYINMYLKNQGFEEDVPAIYYNVKEPSHETINPIVKLGLVHTKTEKNELPRKPQIVLKLAQPEKVLMEGKKRKIKGFLLFGEKRNELHLDLTDFLKGTLTLNSIIE